MVIARFIHSQTAISFGNFRKARQGKARELGRIGIGTGICPAIIIDGTFSGLRSRFFLNVDILVRDQYYDYDGHLLHTASRIFACSRIRRLGIDRQTGKALSRNGWAPSEHSFGIYYS